jgi:diadenosine tetraphosphatase ApaH/serine/threonine PP2A family protein phosphatase
MKALICDIHSNLEALQAVLEDIRANNAEAIYCLGDMVGYGPNPRECLELVMTNCQVSTLGNHDQAVLWDPGEFNPTAEKAAFWTRDQLDAPIKNRDAAERRWEFLAERPMKHKEKDFLFVHASPRNPLNEYIFPEDIYNQRKMDALFALVERYCFHGHTHTPGVFTDRLEFYSPDEIDYTFKLEGRKTLINVGSVGQPRDRDWRASYVLFDESAVRFRRVEYDVETTIKKIKEIDDLDDFLGDRLRDGR